MNDVDNGDDDIGMNNKEWNDFGRQQRLPITNYLFIQDDNDRFEIEKKIYKKVAMSTLPSGKIVNEQWRNRGDDGDRTN